MTILAAGVITVVGLLTATVAQPQSRTGGDRERLIGAWHLVRIDAPGQTRAAQPRGILIYTRDGHVSVQLMYPEAAHAADNEYVRGGYEASFGSYEVDEASHTVTHHVQGSITRDLLAGRDLRRVYQLTSDGHLVIRSANPDEHWSVTWEHY